MRTILACFGDILMLYASLANPFAETHQTEQPAPQLETQQVALLKLFDDFVKTDEGNVLSANLQRFARFV